MSNNTIMDINPSTTIENNTAIQSISNTSAIESSQTSNPENGFVKSFELEQQNVFPNANPENSNNTSQPIIDERKQTESTLIQSLP